MNNRPAILILGPTAGGKTPLAIELAQNLPDGGECISADSMQVYRGMDIGTAKPTADERATAPHHLIDIVEPSDDSFSVDIWLQLAEQTIHEIRTRNRWPIVVGGTNLYVQAFLEGLMDGPAPDDELRAKLNTHSLTELRAWLERVDPNAAERIHQNDRKRTIRAIEVFEKTGQPLSDLQTQWFQNSGREDVFIIGLEYSVETINRRINARVNAMIEAGFVEEVKRLYESNAFGRNAREALGYKQVIDHLDGLCSRDEAIEQIKIRTRRFAKQQRTWLRRFRTHPRSKWLQADSYTDRELAQLGIEEILAVTSQQNGETVV